MLSITSIVPYLFFALLVELSQCAPTPDDDKTSAITFRPRMDCYPHNPGSIDHAAPVVDCAKALLKFPKNAELGKAFHL